MIENQKNENGLSILPVNLPHVWQLATLPALHNDPFDRMLVAQVMAEKMTLATAGRHIARYSALRGAVLVIRRAP